MERMERESVSIAVFVWWMFCLVMVVGGIRGIKGSGCSLSQETIQTIIAGTFLPFS